MLGRRRRLWPFRRYRLFIAMMEKHADQFPIHGIQIAAHNL
jgi:hypothetical protein